jgi:SHS2 domain-containing protein
VGFRFLEHTADLYIEVWGQTIEKSFEEAALALFEVMTDTSTVNPTKREAIVVEARDKHELLYKWLEELILKFEIDHKVYSRFHVEKIEILRGNFNLKATICGEIYDEKRHPSRVGVKAITYHRMTISERKGKTTLKFILDI